MELSEQISWACATLELVQAEIGKRIVGQKNLIKGLLTGILADGHILVEGVPGLAKTLSVQTLAEVLDVDFKRIQFTPDLLPADLTGTIIYKQQTSEFAVRKGPVFTNIVLADEINRAPAKVQSALLEAMSERQVTLGDTTYPLPDPFFVLATQNPIEQEGTYQLPEAQLDRFLMKLNVGYPSPVEELQILSRMGNKEPISIKKVLTKSKILELKNIVDKISVNEKIEKYIVSLITASREKDKHKLPFCRYIEFGASPRASLHLYRCSKIRALFEGRSFVLPEDVKAVAHDVLRHRLVISYEAESEELTADDIVKYILGSVSVP